MIFGLHFFDILVLVAYLLGTTALGIWAAKKVHSSGDFFMSRRFGKTMMLFHQFGTGSHSDQAVGVAAKTFTNGLSGIWYQWLYLFVTPFYWLTGALLRRSRAITNADFMEARFDRSVAIMFSIFGTCAMSMNMGLMLKTSGAVIIASSGGAINEHMAIITMTVLFLVYGVAGGVSAAILTDFVQGILTILFSFMLLPMALFAVGGMSGLRETIHNPEMFSLVAPSEIGFFYIFVLSLNALIGSIANPNSMGVTGPAKSEYDARFGYMAGSFLKRICTIAWTLTGLAAVGYFAGREIEPDQVFGSMAREFLPALLPGLLGLFLAALLASVMSSCDSFMISASALFTENVYRPFVADKSEAHYLMVGRVATVIVVAAGVVYAYWLEDVISGLEIFWKLLPMLGVPIWLSLFWRRTTVAGIWVSCICALFAWWLSSQAFFVEWLAAQPFNNALGLVQEEGGALAMSLPWQMLFYLSVGLLSCVLTSLVTPPVNEEKLERFYELMRTPVQKGEVITQSCRLPAETAPYPRKNLFNAPHWEIPVPSREAVGGFVAGWVIIFILIGALVWIAGLGS